MRRAYWDGGMVLYVPASGSGIPPGNSGLSVYARRAAFMSAAPTLYLNIRQITEVHHKDVLLKDVADIYCDNPALQNK